MITKRMRSVLIPALLYGWRIEQNSRGRMLWDDDPLAPFRSEKTLLDLVGLGLMGTWKTHWHTTYYVTPLASQYKCLDCHRGKLYDDSDEVTGSCPHCDGTGILLQAKNSGDGK